MIAANDTRPASTYLSSKDISALLSDLQKLETLSVRINDRYTVYCGVFATSRNSLIRRDSVTRLWHTKYHVSVTSYGARIEELREAVFSVGPS
jgi:hypothetical protein